MRLVPVGASAKSDLARALQSLAIAQDLSAASGTLLARSPLTGETLAVLTPTSRDEIDALIERSSRAFEVWRIVPAPRRGEFVRLFAEELRKAKKDLALIVTLEAGKIVAEAEGEVQEMIDICDFAVGLSRQLYGKTISSERPHHRMMETWHPLGPVGIITAFNFPVAVWAWNAAIALVCGNPCIWKPSEKGLLAAFAVQALFERACARFEAAPAGLSSVVIGAREAGAILAADARIPLISATGSTAMGRNVAGTLSARLARQILELGGNNAAIVAPSADQDLALRAIAFAAMGTAGQRCTTLRRLFVHRSIYDAFVPRLRNAYRSVAVGDPRNATTLVGPLIDKAAFEAMQQALRQAAAEGATVTGGERVLADTQPNAFYVAPAVAELARQSDLVRRETFAPILYVMPYETIEQAIAANNDVPQGLSSSIFTNDVREAELFTSPAGSDCGIANVNIGPSGAEIGGAFGGEKDTGGGREAGSDSWKAYMRRATNTINFGATLPLAQGVTFEIDE